MLLLQYVSYTPTIIYQSFFPMAIHFMNTVLHQRNNQWMEGVEELSHRVVNWVIVEGTRLVVEL